MFVALFVSSLQREISIYGGNLCLCVYLGSFAGARINTKSTTTSIERGLSKPPACLNCANMGQRVTYF